MSRVFRNGPKRISSIRFQNGAFGCRVSSPLEGVKLVCIKVGDRGLGCESSCEVAATFMTSYLREVLQTVERIFPRFIVNSEMCAVPAVSLNACDHRMSSRLCRLMPPLI